MSAAARGGGHHPSSSTSNTLTADHLRNSERFQDNSAPSPSTSPRARIASNVSSPRSSSGRSARRPRRPPFHSFNQSLVTVLNDPTKPREPDFFTRDWGDAFVPNSAAGFFQGYQQKSSSGLQKRIEIDSVTSEISSRGVSSNGDKDTDADGRTRKESVSAAVPAIYFSKEFDLSESKYFDLVLQPNLFTLDTASSTHEQLSHYLDLVELELSQAISDRSDRFFAALSKQQDLNCDLVDVLRQIRKMRMKLTDAQQDTSDVHLEFLRLLANRKRSYELYQKLSTLAAVRGTQSTIQILLTNSDFVGALDLIATTQEILKNDLKGVHCLKHLGSQLSEMKKVVEMMQATELVETLIEDLNRFSGGSNLKGLALDEMVQEHKGLCDTDDSEARTERLQSLITGVMRSKKSAFIDRYRKAVLSHLQTTIRQQLAASLASAAPADDDTNAPKTQGEHKARLRNMNYEHWADLIRNMCHMMLFMLLQIRANHVRITKCFDTLVEPQPRESVDVVDNSASSSSSSSLSSVLPTTTTIPKTTAATTTSATLPTTTTTTTTTVQSTTTSTSSSTTAEQSACTTPSSTTSPSPTPNTNGDSDDGLGLLEGLEDLEGDPADVGIAEVSDDALALLDGNPGSTVAVEPHSPRSSTTPTTTTTTPPTTPTPTVSLKGVTRIASSSTTPTPTPASTSTSTSPPPTPTPETKQENGRIENTHLDDTTKSETTPLYPSAARLKELKRASLKVVQDSCEMMHERFSQLVTTRKQDKENNPDASIPMNVFIEEYRTMSAFVSCTDRVSTKTCASLRNSLHKQAINFLDRFHEHKKNKLTEIMANERWKKMPEVPSEMQDIADYIMNTSENNSTTPATPVASSSSSSSSSTPTTTTTTPSSTTTTTTPIAKVKHVKIGINEIATVMALLTYLPMIKEYLICCSSMRGLSSEVTNRLLDNFRMFNFHTRKLVLQGGAVNIPGLRLKTITAGNLALASQALNALVQLLGKIRDNYMEIYYEKKKGSMVPDFDTVIQDMNAQKNEIFQKLISILEQEWDRNSEAMTTGWSAMYTTAGAKNVGESNRKLYQVLKSLLSRDEMRYIFKEILVIYNSRLKAAARQRGRNGSAIAVGMAADVVHLEEVLGRLSRDVPIELLREGLSEFGLVLPPLVKGTSA